MAEDDSSSNRSRPESYPLSGHQRAYVSNGETGSYREAKLERRVQEKIDQLGERFNTLFSDVELLYENGYLEEEHYADAWAELLGFDGDDEWAEIVEACHLHADIEGDRPTSAPQELARKFGRLLFMLMLFPDEAGESEPIVKELAWGFLHGLYLDPLDGAPLGEVRRDAIEGTIEYLEERLENELEYDEKVISIQEEWQEQYDARKDAEREVFNRIREILEGTEGVEPEPLDALIDEGYPHGIHPRDVYRYLIDYLTEDPTPEEAERGLNNTFGTAGQEALFGNQYGPIEDPDFLDEVVTRENILAVVKEYNLATQDEIAARVYEDAEELGEAGWKGIDAADVVRAIHNGDAPRSAAIAQEVATDSHQGAVTALCNNLAGRTELAGRTWERDIVNGDSAGWELSTYGEFVGTELADRAKRERQTSALTSLQFKPGLGIRADEIADLMAEAADEIGMEMPERTLE